MNTDDEVKRPFFPKLARKLALPIFLFWVLVAAVVTVFVPSLEKTVAANAEALVPRDSPSSQDAVVEGRAYHESDYTSAAVILLETDGRRLGDQDHQYYDELVRRLLRDKEHVQSLLNLWGKPVTKSGQQSADAEAATLTVRPTGDTGEASASHSIAAIRDIVAKLPKPSGLNSYVSGPGPLSADTDTAATDSMTTLTIVSVIVIIIMLLLAYGSVGRALIPLVGVLIILATARGVVSFLVREPYPRHLVVRDEHACRFGSGCRHRLRRIFRRPLQRSTSSRTGPRICLLHVGRQHIARHLGSGLAISGATLCLSLTKLNYFRTLGPPCFVGMVVAVVGRAHPRSCYAHAGRPYPMVAAIEYHLAQCGAD